MREKCGLGFALRYFLQGLLIAAEIDISHLDVPVSKLFIAGVRIFTGRALVHVLLYVDNALCVQIAVDVDAKCREHVAQP